jgi:hypothetical protein
MAGTGPFWPGFADERPLARPARGPRLCANAIVDGVRHQSRPVSATAGCLTSAFINRAATNAPDDLGAWAGRSPGRCAAVPRGRT